VLEVTTGRRMEHKWVFLGMGNVFLDFGGGYVGGFTL